MSATDKIKNTIGDVAGKAKEALAKVREAESVGGITAAERNTIDGMKAAAAQRAGDDIAVAIEILGRGMRDEIDAGPDERARERNARERAIQGGHARRMARSRAGGLS